MICNRIMDVNGWLSFILEVGIIFICTVIIDYFLALNKEEKKIIKSLICKNEKNGAH